MEKCLRQSHDDARVETTGETGSDASSRTETLRDLYKEKLALAARFRGFSEDRTRSQMFREEFKERAQLVEVDATYLAHCIAWFGDLTLDEIDATALGATVDGMSCEGTNPWIRGIHLAVQAGTAP